MTLSKQPLLNPSCDTRLGAVVCFLCALTAVVVGAEGLYIGYIATPTHDNRCNVVWLQVCTVAARIATMAVISGTQFTPFGDSVTATRLRSGRTSALNFGDNFVGIGSLPVTYARPCFFRVFQSPVTILLICFVRVCFLPCSAIFPVTVSVLCSPISRLISGALLTVSTIPPIVCVTFLARHSIALCHNKNPLAGMPNKRIVLQSPSGRLSRPYVLGLLKQSPRLFFCYDNYTIKGVERCYL